MKTTKEMAEQLGISPELLGALARRKIVPRVKQGHRTVLYEPDVVEEAFRTAMEKARKEVDPVVLLGKRWRQLCANGE